MEKRKEFIKSMHSFIKACDDPEISQIWYCAGWDGEDDSLGFLTGDAEFRALLLLFMWLMGKARLHGGITVDGIHAVENW